MANLFASEELGALAAYKSNGKSKADPAIEQINKALEERSINYSLYKSAKNRKEIGSIINTIREALKDNQNIKEVLNKANKTLDDLNLCS